MHDNWIPYFVPRGKYVHNTPKGIRPAPRVEELKFENILRPEFPFFPVVRSRRHHEWICDWDEDMCDLFGTDYIEIYLKWPIGDDFGMKATVPLVRFDEKNEGTHVTRVELAASIADRVKSHLHFIERPADTPGPPPHDWVIGGHYAYNLSDIFVLGIHKVFPDNRIYWVDLVVPFLLQRQMFVDRPEPSARMCAKPGDTFLSCPHHHLSSY